MVKSPTTTRFLYDGDALVVEYNSFGTVTNRYVHGSNAAADDPLIWYQGAGITGERWLHADHLGSIVAISSTAGGSPTINSYDEYGIPAATNVGRFQYTGQIWLPELGMYHYKARLYSPTLGRFLQTDAIGYDDQVNLYAYVGNDPVNGTDPSGRQSCPKGSDPCPDVPKPDRADRDGMAKAVGPSTRGGDERGGHLLVNPQTGERQMVTGPKAGEGDGGEFRHKVPAKDTPTQKLTLISHTHNSPNEGGLEGRTSARENNAPSEDDQKAMQQRGVAIQIVGPKVTGTLYREGKQDYFAVESGNLKSVPNLAGQHIIVIDDREQPK